MAERRVVITLATAGGQATRRDIQGVSDSLHGLARAAVYAAGTYGLGRLALAGVKWGLSFNAQVESARLRFGLFTRDVQGLTKAVSKIDMSSAFNFGDLSDAAALLGTSGVQNIPKVLQATANAAAASGKGLPALQSISIALAQIQAKGKLSQEEINQLNEAGAPGAQRIIQKAFGLTTKQLSNLGGQGLDATKAVDALTAAWTSGKMAKAAEQQTKTIGGQWDMLTGNLQKLSGAATLGLTANLEHSVLPALNQTAQGITAIFGEKGFSNAQKWQYSRDVIRRNLGPIASDIWADIKRENLPRKLGHEFETGMNFAANAAVNAAPGIVSKFVNAWLGAGPWAKLISGAWLAKKLGLGAGISRLLGGGGRGGIGGALVGRGSITNPMYVVVLDKAPGKGLLGKAGGIAKKLLPGAGALAGEGGLAGIGALGVGALAAGGLGYVAVRSRHNNLPYSHGSTEQRRAAMNRLAAGTIPPPGFGNSTIGGIPSPVDPRALLQNPAAQSILGNGSALAGGFPSSITVPVYIDGRQVARAVTHAANKQKALK